jgi:hypothetical protein
MASWTRDTHQLVVKEETFSDPPGPLIFDNIDLTEGTARFVGTVGASDVTVSVSQTGLWLIERTPADNFNMITVFDTNILAPEYRPSCRAMSSLETSRCRASTTGRVG